MEGRYFCDECGKEIFGEVMEFRYKDEDGYTLIGNICPDCKALLEDEGYQI
jgi:DNA polymerase III alpha subunit (gram-positive type)